MFCVVLSRFSGSVCLSVNRDTHEGRDDDADDSLSASH